MTDSLDRLISEREGMDRGFPASAAVSVVGHLVLVGAAFAAARPGPPPIQVAPAFAVQLPKGGGGSPEAPAPPAANQAKAEDSVEPPAPPKPVKPEVIKPPKPDERKGVPALDDKKVKPKPTPPPRTTGTAATASSSAAPAPTSQTPGLALGLPPGPGTPDGSATGGDWYLAGVQQKIWMLWTRQVKAGFTEPIGVTFTILADGSVADVRVTQPSSATLLNLAAQRAVLTAAPFAPLPKLYGTNRYTIQALFQPTP